MPPNMRIHPTGFASLRSARLRVMRQPLGRPSQQVAVCKVAHIDNVNKEDTNGKMGILDRVFVGQYRK